MSLGKNIALYGTLYSATFSGGFVKGHAVGQGGSSSLGLDAALIGAPLVAGAVAAYVGPSNKELKIKSNHPLGIGLEVLLSGMDAVGEAIGHGLLGTVGTAVMEGLGIGVGYIVGRN